MDQNGCPADYDDLVRHYFAMARSIVAKYPGVRPDDVEDLTQDILLKFYVRDALSWYDPNKTFQTPSGPRTARFPSLFRSFVKKYLRTPVETLTMKSRRERLASGSGEPADELWMEVHTRLDGDPVADEVTFSSELERAYEHLATVQLAPDMTADVVLRAMVVTAAENGGYLRRMPLAERLGVQDTMATRWIRKVRKELNEIGFLREPVAA